MIRKPAAFPVRLSCLLVACIAYGGCTSSYTVSSTPGSGESFDTFNEAAKGELVTIVGHDGRKVHATEVVAGPDSSSFRDDSTGARRVVETHQIERITIPVGGLGILEGLGWGTLSGAGTGLVVAAIMYPFLKDGREIPKEAIFLFMPALGAGAGLILGPIIGGSIGHTDEYRFLNESKQK